MTAPLLPLLLCAAGVARAETGAAAGIAPTATVAGGPPPVVFKDRFGVAMLFPTREGGREWTSRWDNRRPRRLSGRDPDDPELDVSHGDGRYRVDGKGVCFVSGRAPRLYVVDPERKRLWQNVEVTVYGMRISETAPVSFAGLQVYARTDHTRDEDLCADRGYGGRLLFDGRADFEKEIAHHLPNGYVQAATTQVWQRRMVRHRWIGLKFVVRNLPAAVRLELWRDRRNGYNGGKWEKLGEWTDRGEWGVKTPPCAPGVDPAEVLAAPAPSVYIRNDEIGEMRYKWFSVREIAPIE